MSRKKVLAANWKMNLSRHDVAAYMETFLSYLSPDREKILRDVQVIFALPSSFWADFTPNPRLFLSAQNVHWEARGAYTGELSIPMLKEWQISHSLVGHSERRQYFAESDESVLKKITACVSHKITPILCVGETRAERESRQTLSVIKRQLQIALSSCKETPQNFLIAYEPVWAIGTGISATVSEAQEVHHMIRGFLKEVWGSDAAQQVPLLYGGSATPANISSLIAEPDIDGALVGSASLQPEAFASMAQILASH